MFKFIKNLFKEKENFSFDENSQVETNEEVRSNNKWKTITSTTTKIDKELLNLALENQTLVKKEDWVRLLDVLFDDDEYLFRLIHGTLSDEDHTFWFLRNSIFEVQQYGDKHIAGAMVLRNKILKCIGEIFEILNPNYLKENSNCISVYARDNLLSKGNVEHIVLKEDYSDKTDIVQTMLIKEHSSYKEYIRNNKYSLLSLARFYHYELRDKQYIPLIKSDILSTPYRDTRFLPLGYLALEIASKLDKESSNRNVEEVIIKIPYMDYINTVDLLSMIHYHFNEYNKNNEIYGLITVAKRYNTMEIKCKILKGEKQYVEEALIPLYKQFYDNMEEMNKMMDKWRRNETKSFHISLVEEKSNQKLLENFILSCGVKDRAGRFKYYVNFNNDKYSLCVRLNRNQSSLI